MATKKHVVSGDQHYGITGQLLEIQRQMRMRGGSPLDPEKVRIALQRIIEPGNKEGIGLYELSLGDHALDSVLARVRSYEYLDTSFDGREVHPLAIRPLIKEQALAEYRGSGGGKTWIWDKMENNMPYVVPEAKWLNVMILVFGEDFPSNGVPIEMDNLGVRPLVYEELIQYGIKYPEHQKRNALFGLGTRHFFTLCFSVPILYVDDFKRSLDGSPWNDCKIVPLSNKCRFLVVPK